MKKSLLALAALTALTGVAYAQSSVTMFGIVDLNARSVKTGSTTLKTLSTDGNASSRLGFRGVEDLGGGLKAGFWLEAGVAADSGNLGGNNGCTTQMKPSDGTSNAAAYNYNACPTNGSANIFNRRSTVSLMGGFGEVRLGRDYTPSFWNYTAFDPFGTNGVGNMSNLVQTLGSGASTFVRANNTIGYFLPAMGGLYGQFQMAAGEKTLGNKYVGFRIGYAAGPLNVAGAYGKTAKDSGSTTLMRLADYTDMNFGASYNLGFMTLMGQFSKRDYHNNDQTTMLLGTNVPMGAGTFKFAYVKSSGDNKNGATAVLKENDATKMSVGYVYDLSKRTAAYTHFTKENRPAAGSRTASSGDVTGYEFGLRHSF